MNASGYQDVDVVLTTREFGRLLKQAGIDFEKMPEEQFDSPLGASTGAAALFGATGGVMEAALRTVYEVVTGETLANLNFNDVRGMAGVKSSTVSLSGNAVNVAVAHGLANARKILDSIKAGTSPYTFIEVMCCPGGCIGGGGQPYGTTDATRQARIDALYRIDEALPMRKSHENPDIQTLYETFLEKPLGHQSHALLHTTYTDKSV
jgi:NADH-quinone oxidoreductase subunit G/NADP-reducing hydrogenase subunit HndD